MKNLLLFDTSIATENIGDNIIMDYCEQQLETTLKDMYYVRRVPTHLELGKSTYKLNKMSQYKIVCGTNILKTSIILNKGWKIYFQDILNLSDLCLMGVGWGNYNSYNCDLYTKWAYKKILSRNILHSVRDGYTKKRLSSIGINNVLNTACPTMWNLTPDFCESIPRRKGKRVVTALTFYKKDIEKDIEMFNILHQNYEYIYLWIQQEKDLDYFKSLKIPFEVEIIPPYLKAYDKVLDGTPSLDYIGSRLHGGIRALNHKIRSLIIGVDNRATEIHKDTNLPFIKREEIDQLSQWINGNHGTEIFLPVENILEWKEQFK